MTPAEFKTAFEIKVDEDYSSYYSSTQLNNLVRTAQLNVVQRYIDAFQKGDRVSESLKPITIRTTLTGATTPPVTSNSVDLTNATLNYWEAISVRVKFTGNSTNWRTCEPLYFVERGDPFSEGTERNPIYYRSNDLLYVEPTSPAITNMELFYFKNLSVADRTLISFTAASYTIKWSDKVLEEFMDELSEVIAVNMREASLYQMSQQQQLENGPK
jgi:hypothetical protein